jgi:para-nitrobenzyl esterase
MPFLWSTYTDRDLANWPIFQGIDRARLAQVARSFSNLYGSFVRTGDPGPPWKRFGTEDHDILWLAETLGTRSRSLDGELEVFHTAGLPNIDALEDALTANLRAALNE